MGLRLELGLGLGLERVRPEAHLAVGRDGKGRVEASLRAHLHIVSR